MFGLLDHDHNYILKALRSLEEIDSARIFGSRAIGNYKKGSDVDIAIIGKSISSTTISKLDELLNEEYPLPYFFDILHYEEINNEKLIEHIDTVGKELYRKGINDSSNDNDFRNYIVDGALPFGLEE
ncbi:nucleotidyltransferase domain-containing protein [Cytobacillus sp. S13-E01]|uniref:nucleotidyltransferase family protein n=1 Tax=Cytobacillus sp. S13-E01 TaxID=3031326 RepID=UPI0023D8A132|nr:nucleotidyltransferase domain-containing protein [Cytobacillus sp. S13-E01]MDF0728954.1 nucleotidyltransferase domain-containing protein [Cytobacillus sp. S13-E01]